MAQVNQQANENQSTPQQAQPSQPGQKPQEQGQPGKPNEGANKDKAQDRPEGEKKDAPRQ